MTSINPFETFHYEQPDEYHFSHDSVFLARKVFELLITSDISHFQVLDLCAGCGIVGLDFIFHNLKEKQSSPREVDFLEVQNIYLEYFKKNVATLAGLFPGLPKLNFVCENYNQLVKARSGKTYDLILSNPPFFWPGQGALSPSEFKNRCRFFLDSTFPLLIESVISSLKPTGRAYLLLKAREQHGVNIEKELQSFSSRIEALKIGSIRNTDLFEIRLNS